MYGALGPATAHGQGSAAYRGDLEDRHRSGEDRRPCGGCGQGHHAVSEQDPDNQA